MTKQTADAGGDSNRPLVEDVGDPRWIRAVAHPLRVRLLALLGEQDASPVMLARSLDLSLATTSYHVRKLFHLGLLDLVGTQRRRGATEHIYRARAHPSFAEDGWKRLETIPKQRLITAALNEILDSATRSAAAGGFDATNASILRTSLNLDVQGWTELAQATTSWFQEAERIESGAAARLVAGRGPRIGIGLAVLLFEAAPRRPLAHND